MHLDVEQHAPLRKAGGLPLHAVDGPLRASTRSRRTAAAATGAGMHALAGPGREDSGEAQAWQRGPHHWWTCARGAQSGARPSS